MNLTLFKSLCKDGKFKEALSLATNGYEEDRLAPSRFSLDKKTGNPIFYRGNKRVELNAEGEWQISKNTNFS
ncbi:hypothetical protein P8H26_14920 [Pseudochrobactrum sp. sp1633]|uniref:hypothetical protein n=1 Tax=Pseudochrobactrum sp. sp1633 TaxID=3036706 RepID=UPI0025A56E67|nr:hypothetical protein [Pseudochrobactrum sp. sp1633]MDM8346683.1 hypothetical protein [Pseudochrobactrum sp. sp1633]HWD13405.1 hypothetical protein [Pseudochrobactrum sp.]